MSGYGVCQLLDCREVVYHALGDACPGGAGALGRELGFEGRDVLGGLDLARQRSLLRLCQEGDLPDVAEVHPDGVIGAVRGGWVGLRSGRAVVVDSGPVLQLAVASLDEVPRGLFLHRPVCVGIPGPVVPQRLQLLPGGGLVFQNVNVCPFAGNLCFH